MQDPGPQAEPSTAFPIRYSRFGDTVGNPEFQGKGLLSVEESGQRFVFSGKPLGSALIGRPSMERALRADKVWNVMAKGTRVQFLTSEGAAGLRKVPFSFHCMTADAASRVAALLPPTRDADFQAMHDFHANQSGFEAASPWSSVTNVIIAANILVFATMGLLGAGWLTTGDIMVYVRFGANNAAATTDGQWWRLLTSMFMHYGVMHLALNMWALAQVGHLVERLFGRKAYALLYFTSGITGGLASMAWHGDRMWSAGASGAIFGVYGSLLGFMQRDEQLLPKSVYKPLLKSTALFVAYNLFYGAVQSGVDNAAHLGGLFGGFVIGWLTAVPLNPELRERFAARRLRSGIVAAVLMVGCGVAIAPRFGYNPQDELRWQKSVSPRVSREAEIVSRQNAEINRYRSSGDPAKLSILLTFEAIPFYEGWRDELVALPLQQGMLTDRRRVAVARVIQMRIDSFRHLLSAFNGPEPYPLRRFEDESKDIAAAIKDVPVE
jgi:rhomboid protease GluP